MTADHERMEALLAPYMLGACDEEERGRVAAHLRACWSCRADRRRLAQAVAVVPLAADEVRPPERLRARIVAAAAERPAAPILTLTVHEDRTGRRRRPFRLWWAAVATLTLAVMAATSWDVVLHQALNAPPERFAMVGTGSMAGASGTVAVYRRQDLTVVTLTGLPQPPAGQVYEVWLVGASGRPSPGGVFTPAADGTARVVIDRSPSDVRAVNVTPERGPAGARAPTQTKPELAGQVGG